MVNVKIESYNDEESLNSDGQKFRLCQQNKQAPLTPNH